MTLFSSMDVEIDEMAIAFDAYMRARLESEAIDFHCIEFAGSPAVTPSLQRLKRLCSAAVDGESLQPARRRRRVTCCCRRAHATEPADNLMPVES